MSVRNFYYVSKILGKAIALSSSYQLISEGNRSTIKNIASLGNPFSPYKNSHSPKLIGTIA